MTNRLNYLHDEWLTLARAPLAAMVAMKGAGRASGMENTREFVAIQQTLRATRENAGSVELILALVVETEAQAAEHFQHERATLGFAHAQDRALAAWACGTCREAAAILTAKAPSAEAAEYRRWVRWLARTVAQGAGEGQAALRRISPDEELLLAELEAALAGPPSSA